jgi:hypothetical protein
MVTDAPPDPSRPPHFAGRKAHDLTYTSCQQSHRSERLWRRIDKLLARNETVGSRGSTARWCGPARQHYLLRPAPGKST